MSRCRRCNRQLKTEPWASMEIGKICSKKEAGNDSKSTQSKSDTDTIVPYDGGDIWIKRLEAPTDFLGVGVTMNVAHPCSGIETNVQRSEYRHSPTGFNFGYGGSGPADLALNILLMFTDKKTADKLYQVFKFQFLQIRGDHLTIPKQSILTFIAENKIPVL